jgi:2-polyprenyl-3-methyl-5-hydroxy-6-metoxy-1,4-benzoquinol methylase
MKAERLGDYEERGDYHRELDPNWSYAPIYRRKLALVDAFVSRLPREARILDVGAGEGVLVDKYRGQGLKVVGVDANYESPSVKKADLASLPFEDRSFDAVLCLDVLEHLDLMTQTPALLEMRRCLATEGTLLLSVPNLAHLHSRLRFFLGGTLTRTSAVERHPGDRPAAEYLRLLRETGFRVVRRDGVFPTVPIVFRLVNRNPARWGWAVGMLDKILPFPGLCFLNVIEAKL